MDEAIIESTYSERTRGCSQISFFAEISIEVLVDQHPYSDIELTLPPDQ